MGDINVNQHGSDSGVYDKEGRFLPQMFEDLFSKWDVSNEGALSACQLRRMIAGNRLAADPFGVSGTGDLLPWQTGADMSDMAVGSGTLRVWHDMDSSPAEWGGVQGGSAPGI